MGTLYLLPFVLSNNPGQGTISSVYLLPSARVWFPVGKSLLPVGNQTDHLPVATAQPALTWAFAHARSLTSTIYLLPTSVYLLPPVGERWPNTPPAGGRRALTPLPTQITSRPFCF
jgi:hypothetical protein